MKKYWYLFTWIGCPVCGRGHTYKERMYSPKPKGYLNRHKESEIYDYCNA